MSSCCNNASHTNEYSTYINEWTISKQNQIKFAYSGPTQPYTLATCVYTVDEMIPIFCVKGALNINTVTQAHTYSPVCTYAYTPLLNGIRGQLCT